MNLESKEKIVELLNKYIEDDFFSKEDLVDELNKMCNLHDIYLRMKRRRDEMFDLLKSINEHIQIDESVRRNQITHMVTNTYCDILQSVRMKIFSIPKDILINK